MSVLRGLFVILLMIIYSFPVRATDKSQLISEIVDGFWLERVTQYSVESYEQLFVRFKQQGHFKTASPASIRSAAETVSKAMNSELQKFKPSIRSGLITALDSVYSEDEIIYYHSQIKNPIFQSYLLKNGEFGSMLRKEVIEIQNLAGKNIQKIIEAETLKLKQMD